MAKHKNRRGPEKIQNKKSVVLNAIKSEKNKMIYKKKPRNKRIHFQKQGCVSLGIQSEYPEEKNFSYIQ